MPLLAAENYITMAWCQPTNKLFEAKTSRSASYTFGVVFLPFIFYDLRKKVKANHPAKVAATHTRARNANPDPTCTYVPREKELKKSVSRTGWFSGIMTVTWKTEIYACFECKTVPEGVEEYKGFHWIS